jgi:UDP-N-acetylglucosamine--N-acetylmuramyl-(pentapeptide) pyrophosphoryl-undecaprenol N-acetylglucosamine transferase
VKLAVAIVRGYFYVKRFEPQVVVGVGGYVSLPLCYAAQKAGVPTVLHEQNKRLGMANQLLARRATRLLLSFPETIGGYPETIARVVGNPVRAGFIKPPDQKTARAKMGLDPSIPVILVSGGSQGAHTLNAAMAEAILAFQPGEIQFLWMTGNADVSMGRAAAEKAKVRVEVFPFIDDMVSACAAADLVVTRSGASTTAEIAVLGKPSILVPYPHATDNHQEQNARAFEKAEAAIVLLDDECSGGKLAQLMRDTITHPERLEQMRRGALSLAKPGAAEAIVEEILTLAFEE